MPSHLFDSISTYNIFNTRLPYLEEINEGFCRYKEEFPDVEDPNIIVYLDDYITQVASPDFSPPFFPVPQSITRSTTIFLAMPIWHRKLSYHGSNF